MKIILLLALRFIQPCEDDSTSNKVISLPTEKIVPVFTADTRANRLSFQRNFDENSYTASMGGIFPLVNMNRGKLKSQLSTAGSTYLTLLRYDNSGSVRNVDFFVDLLFDIKLSKNWIMRLGTSHTSQHLSDDAIIAGSLFKNFAKDYHQVMAVYQSKKHGILGYGGIEYIYNFKTNEDLSNNVLLHVGFEHYPFFTHKKWIKNMYYAGDIKLRQELNFAHTANFQLGYKISYNNKRAMRIAYDYTEGVNEIGYYQPQNRNFSHLGIYLDF